MGNKSKSKQQQGILDPASRKTINLLGSSVNKLKIYVLHAVYQTNSCTKIYYLT